MDELARMVLNRVPAMAVHWNSDLRRQFANRALEGWFGARTKGPIGEHMEDLLTVLDVEDRKLALRESEERARLAFEEAPIGIAVINMEGCFLRVNRALCDMLGYSARELAGMRLQGLARPEDLGAYLDMTAKLARGDVPRCSKEMRCVRNDGRVVDIELSGSVVRGAMHRSSKFIVQIEDITARKRTEAEQQFLAELGPVLASTLDPDEAFDRIVQLVTRRIADFCILDTVDVLGDGEEVQRKRVSSRGGEQWLAEGMTRVEIDRTKPYLLREAVLSRRPVLLRQPSEQDLAALAQGTEHLRLLTAMNIGSMVAVPIIAGERLIGGIALVASKGSREYDDRDAKFAQELGRRIAICMDNARLYAAARKASKVRDEVLGIVAHDLRNPLSTIAMQAEMLRRRARAGAGTEAAAGDVIDRAARRMRRLIEDLLDVSRMEAVGLTIEQALLNPVPFLSDCVESQRHLAESASIDLCLQASADLPALWADRDRLSQVLENLIGNALKFSRSGGRITVAADEVGDDVWFSVRDTGAGIPREDLPHLFDRFWQARRADREGAGLGLAIVKGVVEAHGGRIWVESTLGEGSCFFFTIPRRS